MDQPVGRLQRYSTGLKVSWVLALLAPAVGLPVSVSLGASSTWRTSQWVWGLVVLAIVPPLASSHLP